MHRIALLLMVFLLPGVALSEPGDAFDQPFASAPGKPLRTIEPRSEEREPDATARIPGETYADAIDMTALPFQTAGSLFDYEDDIHFGYGTSPDVVYMLTPQEEGCVTVDGCGSTYDQMIFVVDELHAVMAWNDDGTACGSGASQISWLSVPAGERYYYVIDGFGGAMGDYELRVAWIECPPPPICPPGAILEGEPDCYDGYVDHYNGGCTSVPFVFMEVPCSEGTIVYFGETGTYYNDSGQLRRDNDCYILRPWQPMTVSIGVYGESSVQLESHGCFENCVCTIGWARSRGPREWLRADFPIYPVWYEPTYGYVFTVAKNYYDPNIYPCEESWPYLFTIDGYTCPPSGNESESWGRVKALFRN